MTEKNLIQILLIKSINNKNNWILLSHLDMYSSVMIVLKISERAYRKSGKNRKNIRSTRNNLGNCFTQLLTQAYFAVLHLKVMQLRTSLANRMRMNIN